MNFLKIRRLTHATLVQRRSWHHLVCGTQYIQINTEGEFKKYLIECDRWFRVQASFLVQPNRKRKRIKIRKVIQYGGVPDKYPVWINSNYVGKSMTSQKVIIIDHSYLYQSAGLIKD